MLPHRRRPPSPAPPTSLPAGKGGGGGGLRGTRGRRGRTREQDTHSSLFPRRPPPAKPVLTSLGGRGRNEPRFEAGIFSRTTEGRERGLGGGKSVRSVSVRRPTTADDLPVNANPTSPTSFFPFGAPPPREGPRSSPRSERPPQFRPGSNRSSAPLLGG